MFNIPRKVAYSHSLKCLARSYRPIYSGRSLQWPPNVTYKDSSNESVKSDGYGEKEIFLLGPIDIRTPLPGNTGIPPISMFYNDTLRQLPKSSGEKSDLFSAQSPEERYRNTLVQVACVAVERILSSSPMLECVAHDCPQLLRKDFTDLFPDRDLSLDNLTVMTLCQHTDNDMSEWSEVAELERDNLGKFFIVAAQAICVSLRESGYWADFIHPNSGRPHMGHLSNSSMLETDLRYRHFGFKVEDQGCCKIISHFLWGTRAYVGAIFTNAPLGSVEVKELLSKLSFENSAFSSSES